jgi:hypothetical protein
MPPPHARDEWILSSKRVPVKDQPLEKGDMNGLIPHNFEGDLVGRGGYLSLTDGGH